MKIMAVFNGRTMNAVENGTDFSAAPVRVVGSSVQELVATSPNVSGNRFVPVNLQIYVSVRMLLLE